jgi:hypothetical protein
MSDDHDLTPPACRLRARRALGRVGAALTALAVAAGLMTISAGPAGADQVCSSGSDHVICFNLTRMNGTSDITVHLGIDVHMSRQDAQAIIDSPGEEFSAVVIGDDPVYDNTQKSVPVTWSAAWEGGLSAELDVVATFAELNEDDGFFDGYVDELFGRIRLVDPRTGRVRTFNSPTISGYY